MCAPARWQWPPSFITPVMQAEIHSPKVVTMTETQRQRNPIRVAMVGGGLTALTTAYELLHKHRATPYAITIFEASTQLGGLAAGFKGHDKWEWPLEHFYHHIFTNDDAIIGLTRELGMGERLAVHSPTTVLHHRGHDYPLDSPLRLLRCHFEGRRLEDRWSASVALGSVVELQWPDGVPWAVHDTPGSLVSSDFWR